MIITAKIFMQHLWVNKIDWDDKSDYDMTKQWLSWYQDLSVLNNLELNRWLGYNPDADLFEIQNIKNLS